MTLLSAVAPLEAIRLVHASAEPMAAAATAAVAITLLKHNSIIVLHNPPLAGYMQKDNSFMPNSQTTSACKVSIFDAGRVKTGVVAGIQSRVTQQHTMIAVVQEHPLRQSVSAC